MTNLHQTIEQQTMGINHNCDILHNTDSIVDMSGALWSVAHSQQCWVSPKRKT